MPETVILVHGFAEDSRIWDSIVPELRKDYDVLTPDLPGSGTNPVELDEVSIETLADFLHSLMEKKQLKSCSMIGHSMGGYITLAFAEKYPELVDRIGLFHSSAYADDDEKKQTRKKNIDFIQRNGAEKFVAQSVPKLFSEQTAKENPGMIRDMIERYRNFSADSLVHYTAAMMNRPDRIRVLETFKKPVLFIVGEQDTNIPIELGLKQCSIPEFSYIYIATQSGHLGMLEETGFCVKAMKEFLAGN